MKYLTARSIAVMLDISMRSARRLIRTKLEHIKVGRGEYRVEESEFQRYIKKKQSGGAAR